MSLKSQNYIVFLTLQAVFGQGETAMTDSFSLHGTKIKM